MTAFEKPQLVLRLFVMLVALIVSVQPFADEVRNDTSCDRDQEPKMISMTALLSVRLEKATGKL